MPWLELSDACVALGGKRARRDILTGITAAVDAGDLVVIVGPNGAG